MASCPANPVTRCNNKNMKTLAIAATLAAMSALAGVPTDYTEIGLLWSNIGRRTATWLPIITVPQIVLFGYARNILVVA